MRSEVQVLLDPPFLPDRPSSSRIGGRALRQSSNRSEGSIRPSRVPERECLNVQSDCASRFLRKVADLISFREKNQQHCWSSRVWERPQRGDAELALPTAPVPPCFLRRPDVCRSETTVVVQVKYTNPHDPSDHAMFFPPPETDIAGLWTGRAGKYAFWFRNRGVVVNQLPHCDFHICGYLFLDQIKREKGVWWMPWQ